MAEANSFPGVPARPGSRGLATPSPASSLRGCPPPYAPLRDPHRVPQPTRVAQREVLRHFQSRPPPVPSRRLTAGRAASLPHRPPPPPRVRRPLKCPDGKRRPQGGRQPAASPALRQLRREPAAPPPSPRGPNGGLTLAAFGSAPPPSPAAPSAGRSSCRRRLLPLCSGGGASPARRGRSGRINVCARPGPRHREAETAAAGTAPPSAPLPRSRSPAFCPRPLLASFPFVSPGFVRPGAAPGPRHRGAEGEAAAFRSVPGGRGGQAPGQPPVPAAGGERPRAGAEARPGLRSRERARAPSPWGRRCGSREGEERRRCEAQSSQ